MADQPIPARSEVRIPPLSNKPHLLFYKSRIDGGLRILDLDSPQFRPRENRAVLRPNGVNFPNLEDAVSMSIGSMKVFSV